MFLFPTLEKKQVTGETTYYKTYSNARQNKTNTLEIHSWDSKVLHAVAIILKLQKNSKYSKFLYTFHPVSPLVTSCKTIVQCCVREIDIDTIPLLYSSLTSFLCTSVWCVCTCVHLVPCSFISCRFVWPWEQFCHHEGPSCHSFIILTIAMLFLP